MKVEQDLISLIFTEHGVCESWQKLPSTGVANEIYATEDVILRIATDHPDGICDARTESVAAPAACRAGVLTPRLLVFDDSRAIANSPYSMWERVKGETLGFLHDDLHDMNIMCTRDDELLALIDWGDAGWGDPAQDFIYVPLPVLSQVLAAYREIAPDNLGSDPEIRIIWDKLNIDLENKVEDSGSPLNTEAYKDWIQDFMAGRNDNH